MKKRIVIVGGGAAGMMAGIILAEQGYAPEIYEKNEKLGKKLFITGKGRCNLMNDCSPEIFFQNVVSNSKFLFSAFCGFDAEATKNFFRKLGLSIKTERGNRVFPESDHSSDVINVLAKKLKNLSVPIHLDTTVTKILTDNFEDYEDNILYNKADGDKKRNVKGVYILNSKGNEEFINADKVVVATGGLSYPLTGSTGDGIRWAEEMGLKVIPPTPSLVPMCIREEWCRQLMGLSLKNVAVSFHAKVKNKVKEVYADFGEMIFTHFGVSGPVILSASSYIGKYLDSEPTLTIDLKPALSEEQLDERVLRDFSGSINKQFRNALGDLLPKSLIPVMIELSGIDPYKKVNEIGKDERKHFVWLLKNLTMHVKGFRDFNEAIITKGGVSVKELNPKNMESKKISGLYFIGEVIDVDALTGGFNLQIAWSTAAALSQIEV